MEQYLHPEHDIIPKQSLRPSRLKNIPNMEFRHTAKDGYHDTPNIEGLGRFTDTQNKDYSSVYDIWDFETDSPLIGDQDSNPIIKFLDYGAKKILQKAGTPYAVYERFPHVKDK